MDHGDEVKFDMASGKNYSARKWLVPKPSQAPEPSSRPGQAPPRPSQARRPWPRGSVGEIFNEYFKREKIDQSEAFVCDAVACVSGRRRTCRSRTKVC